MVIKVSELLASRIPGNCSSPPVVCYASYSSFRGGLACFEMARR